MLGRRYASFLFGNCQVVHGRCQYTLLPAVSMPSCPHLTPSDFICGWKSTSLFKFAFAWVFLRLNRFSCLMSLYSFANYSYISFIHLKNIGLFIFSLLIDRHSLYIWVLIFCLIFVINAFFCALSLNFIDIFCQAEVLNSDVVRHNLPWAQEPLHLLPTLFNSLLLPP